MKISKQKIKVWTIRIMALGLALLMVIGLFINVLA